MKRRLLFLALLLPLCVAAQPIIRQSLTTNTADNPSTGQSPVWNGTKWVMASTNQFGGGGGGGSGTPILHTNNYAGSTTNFIFDCNTISNLSTVRITLTNHCGWILSNAVDGLKFEIEAFENATGGWRWETNSPNWRWSKEITGPYIETNAGYISVYAVKIVGTNGQIRGNLNGFAP